MHQRALAIADARARRAEIGIVERAAKMQLCVAHFGHEDQPPVEAAIVAVGLVDIVGEDARLRHQRSGGIGQRRAEPALEAERVGKGGAFDEGGVQAAGQLFERLEIVVMADDDFESAILVGQDRIGDVDFVAREVDFDLVSEAARNIARCAEPCTADLVAEPIVAAGRIGDIGEARIEHQASARGEAPAIALRQRGGGGRGRGGRCLGNCSRIGGILRPGLSQLAFELVDPRIHRGELRAHRGQFVGGDGHVLRIERSGHGAGQGGGQHGRAEATGHLMRILVKVRLRSDDASMTGKLRLCDRHEMSGFPPFRRAERAENRSSLQSSSGPARLNVTVTRVPSPSSLVISSRPRCRSTICLTMARPRPVPPEARLRPGSVR